MEPLKINVYDCVHVEDVVILVEVKTPYVPPKILPQLPNGRMLFFDCPLPTADSAISWHPSMPRGPSISLFHIADAQAAIL